MSSSIPLQRARLALIRLEDRTVPATLIWTSVTPGTARTMAAMLEPPPEIRMTMFFIRVCSHYFCECERG
jgi:hypothetical protein